MYNKYISLDQLLALSNLFVKWNEKALLSVAEDPINSNLCEIAKVMLQWNQLPIWWQQQLPDVGFALLDALTDTVFLSPSKHVESTTKKQVLAGRQSWALCWRRLKVG